MSILSHDPQPSLSGRTHRALSFLAHHHSSLKHAFEYSDWAAAALTVALVVSWMKAWSYPEWLRSVSESVHVAAAALVAAYVVSRLLLSVARRVLVRKNPFGMAEEVSVNWEEPCWEHVAAVRSPAKSQEDYGKDLDEAVKLCHESLGFEHDQFSTEDRRCLYDCWCKANEKSMLLLIPQFGAAKGKAIGVTIVLPLSEDGISYIQDRKGGVLKLDGRHILPIGRRVNATLLIDTLLVEDEWIAAYGPLALKGLFHHLSMFYNSRFWMQTELYCCIHRGGTVGKYLRGIRGLIEDRGFKEFGRTAEGETIFRLCIRSFAADPLTKPKHDVYRAALEKSSDSLKRMLAQRPSGGSPS